MKLHNVLVSKAAEMCEQKCKNNIKNKHSGYVINTCGWIDGGGYNSLLYAANAFEVDVVLVLDSERLYNDFQKDLPNSTSILRLPKSGGVVARSREFRRKTREESVREYFYGKKGVNSYFPFSFEIPFSSVSIYKIGAPEVPESCLPIGAKAEDGNTQLVPVEIDKEIMHSIVSVSMATSLEDDLVTSSIAGFLCINGVNMEAQILTVLSPAPGPLPRKFLLLSDIKFIDFK